MAKTTKAQQSTIMGALKGAVKRASKKKVEDTSCEGSAATVQSDASATTPTESTPADAPGTAKDTKMNLTLKGLDKRGRNAIYTGGAVALRFPIGAFENKTAPASLAVDGIAGPKAAKVPETKEQRKARLAAAPKPTLAERVARAEKRTADLKAKLEKDNAAAAAASQPSL